MSRRPLSHAPGEITLHGPEPLAAPLAELLVRSHELDPDALTHGFHSWPGRMHRALAGGLLELLVPRPGARVLDPFVGGGTVLIEALVRGHHAVGVDLNPLSRLVVGVKTRRTSGADREAFLVLASGLEERALERVRERRPAMAHLASEHLSLYGTHTLKELAGLLEEIRALDRGIDPSDREAALAVFSSIVQKVSNRRADTSDEAERKRIRKGLSSELFRRKAEELSERWAALEAAIGPRRGGVELLTGDARLLPRVLGRRRVDAIVTSPPYGGTYDYAAQHALRLDWLGLSTARLEREEIGARRRQGRVERWDAELHASLRAMRAVLAGPEARIALVLGDAQLGRERLDAHAQVLGMAPSVGLRPIAAASELREDRLGGPARREHVMILAPL